MQKYRLQNKLIILRQSAVNNSVTAGLDLKKITSPKNSKQFVHYQRMINYDLCTSALPE